MTNNLASRLRDHKNGYSPYTKKFNELELVYREDHKRRRDAEARERQLKGWSVAKKKALIADNKVLLIKLSKSREIVDEMGG